MLEYFIVIAFEEPGRILLNIAELPDIVGVTGEPFTVNTYPVVGYSVVLGGLDQVTVILLEVYVADDCESPVGVGGAVKNVIVPVAICEFETLNAFTVSVYEVPAVKPVTDRGPVLVVVCSGFELTVYL